jgi:lipopolysaccharide assembly outer membrane protein LptD (OstA)
MYKISIILFLATIISTNLVASVFVYVDEDTAATVAESDTIDIEGGIIDTLVTAEGDTIIVDRSEFVQSGVDTVVVYSAQDSVVYSVQERKMRLYEEGDIRYRKMQLRAARITFDWDKSELFAEGVPKDTVIDGGASSLKVLKNFYTGLPVMRDGPEEYEGYTIAYNFATRRGRMTMTDTEIEQGFYYGRTAKKMENDVLYLADGVYTTCDADHPHFHFYSPRMRIVPGSSVAAAPIYLYVMDVPVFAIPFGIFPTQSGRRSGFITPTFGESAQRGRFLTNLGYYWAISDYVDLATKADWYTKGGWVLNADMRYNLRYRFTGAINASTSYSYSGERGDPQRTEQRDYRLFVRHSQEIDPTSRIDVNFNYMTGQYYQATSLDFDQLFTQNIISNATFSKRWEGSNNSMTVNVNRDHNIRTDEVRWILPNISFNRTTSYPLRRDARDRRPGEAFRWYELIGYTYSGNAQNYITTSLDRSTPDTSLVTDYQAGATHAVNISASQREGFITYSPNFRYNEVWYTERIERYWDETDSSVATRSERGFYPVRYFNTGISFQTTIYGIFQPRIGNVTGFRHTVTPNISYNYRPDFSSTWWGYYDYFENPETGQVVKYHRFEGQPFSGAPTGEQQMISFSVGNLFEMKTAPADTAQDERRYQLLNLNFSGSYNFAADSLRFGDIFANFRTSVGNFSFSGSASFSLYAFDRQLGRMVNRFQIDETGSLLRFQDFRISMSTSLRGGTRGATLPYDFDDLLYPMNPYINTMRYYDYRYRPAVVVPWDVSFSWDFGYSQRDPRTITRRSTINASVSVSLTEKWHIRASSGYDIFQGDFTTPSITVTRDLHCWDLFFSWVPTGFNQYYRLEIRVKAPHLQDLKVSKRGSARGIY